MVELFRKIEIVRKFHLLERITNYPKFGNLDNPYYYKYILPDDWPKFQTGWRAKIRHEKCENLVLKKIIKEAMERGKEP